jgi:hypothetical protein
MVSFPDEDDWVPPRAFSGDPHAVFVVKSGAGGVVTSWEPPGSTLLEEFVRKFLENRMGNLSDGDLSLEVNFAYVVLRRAPLPGEEAGTMGRNTPIAEFGYGSPPAAPEAWPLVELRVVLQEAVRALRGSRKDG